MFKSRWIDRILMGLNLGLRPVSGFEIDAHGILKVVAIKRLTDGAAYRNRTDDLRITSWFEGVIGGGGE